MRGTGTGRVFISYRRQETAWPALQLYDLLSTHFGADQVFKDVDDIDPGDDFVDKLTRAVGSCDVLLALIGDRWLTITDEEGRRRLDNPGDFVRVEIATALRRPDVRVIPILVDAARMPRPQDLPPDLEPLVRRQAVQLNAIAFDATRLMRILDRTLAEMHGEAADAGPGPGTEHAEPQEDSRDRGDGGGPLGPATDGGTGRPTTGPDHPLAPPTHPGLSRRRRTVLFSSLAGVGVLAAVLVTIQLASGHGTRNAPPGSGAASAGSSAPAAAGVDGPDVLAHRGSGEEYPPETERALLTAAAKGYAVETDVRWTSDNVPVLVHDDQATEGLECVPQVNVSQTTWQRLRTVCTYPSAKDHKDYPIARYDRVMEQIAGVSGAWAYVEVKVDQTPEQTRTFLRAINDNDLGSRTVVTSFDPGHLRAIHAAAPRLRLMRFTASQLPVGELEREHLWAVAVRSDAATKAYVRELHRAGLVVVDWPVNDPAAWARARSVGADKVLTDHPTDYRAWLARQ